MHVCSLHVCRLTQQLLREADVARNAGMPAWGLELVCVADTQLICQPGTCGFFVCLPGYILSLQQKFFDRHAREARSCYRPWVWPTAQTHQRIKSGITSQNHCHRQ